MNRRKILLLAVAAAMVASALVWLHLHPPERTFQGKEESWWFTNITYRASHDEIDQWRSYGPEGVQVLMHGLGKGNGVFERFYFNEWPKLPRAVRRKLPQPVSFRAIRMCAGSMLDQMGTNAAPALPVLLYTLRVDRDDSVRQIVLGCFSKVLPVLDEKEKLALLPEFIKATQSRDSGVRNNAIVALYGCTNHPDVVVPVMIKMLQDPDNGVRLTSARMLYDFDHQAALNAGIVRVVADCLANPKPTRDVSVENNAVRLLGDLKSDPELVVPLLIRALHSPEKYVRGNSASSLGKFGSEAKAAVPELVKALQDPDEYVRNQAAGALKRIDPEAATETGVK